VGEKETPKQILVLSQAFDRHYTGWAKHTQKLLSTLNEKNHGAEFSLLTSSGEASSTVPLVRQTITTPFQYGEGAWTKFISGVALIFYYLATYQKWDLVYCSNYYFPVPLIILLADVLGRKSVVRIAGQEMTATGWRRLLREEASRRTDGIIVLNSTVRQALLENGVSAQKIDFIPNGVDTNIYSPNEIDGTAKDKRSTQLLCVAAVCERKGIHHVIAALARLKGSRDLELTVVGPYNEGESPREYTESLESIIETHGLEDRVRFVGRVNDVAPYYQKADIFILPSYEEGMPNVLLEAMACQLPCVATAIPGVMEVVADGETALLVKPRSVEDIVDAIERLLGNDYFAKQLGKSARAQIEEFFDVKGMVYSYDNKFNKILYK
jgi:glycosyltransferase involved in cell wall biosynthesis